VIPGNDDALRAIRLFASRIADAVISGRGMKESAEAETSRDSADEGADDGRRQVRPPRRTREAAPASA
jgi:small subunit ribosomal protein S2